MVDRALAVLTGKLEREVQDKTTVDVGKGAEEMYGVSQYKFREALKALQAVGYPVYTIKVPQKNSPKIYKAYKVLTKPDVTWAQAAETLRQSLAENTTKE